jgi:hypothetical protein
VRSYAFLEAYGEIAVNQPPRNGLLGAPPLSIRKELVRGAVSDVLEETRVLDGQAEGIKVVFKADDLNRLGEGFAGL